MSDRQITRESGILDLLQAGDVMFDCRLDISTLVPAGVTVNMPPFLAGHDQMTATETEETMNIASVRIHVERAIGCIKAYHILDGTLPNTLRLLRTFAGVLGEKIRLHAILKENMANYISLESLINVDFGKKL